MIKMKKEELKQIIKEEIVKINGIESFIESENDISDIRSEDPEERKVIRINFTEDVYGDDEELEELQDEVESYIYSKYKTKDNNIELDWVGSDEVEVIITMN
jgi:hypothetical protein